MCYKIIDISIKLEKVVEINISEIYFTNFPFNCVFTEYKKLFITTKIKFYNIPLL